MRIEADEATDLDDGDPPLGHQATYVTQARPQSARNLVHGEERRRRTLLAAFGTAQGTGGRPRGTAARYRWCCRDARCSPETPFCSTALDPLGEGHAAHDFVVGHGVEELPEGVVDVGGPPHHGESDEVPDEGGHQVAKEGGPFALPDEPQLRGAAGE